MSTQQGKRTEPHAQSYRLRRMRNQSLKPPIGKVGGGADVPSNFSLDVGWGRLLFGQTFESAQEIARTLRAETPGERDIAFYIRDPHVALAAAPQQLFLDPSHTYRLDLATYRPTHKPVEGVIIRRLCTQADAEAVNRIYIARGMAPVAPEFFWKRRDSRVMTFFVAEDEATGEIVGTVTGVDHARAFGDPEHGASLWCLAVDSQQARAGTGTALVRRLADLLQARGCAYLDLSVLHDNSSAIGLYEKLGFRRIPVFALKKKNPINEKLFIGELPEEKLNPYARIIVDEARRRGVNVEILDGEGGFFRLSHGGRQIACREALSELTTAVAMSICDDKVITRRFVEKAGLRVPDQADAEDQEAWKKILEKSGSVVVKPARGEQGRGIAVGVKSEIEVKRAILRAREVCDRVLVEELVEGHDMRLVVIDYEVVAVAMRKPAAVVGDGKSTVAHLIELQSRRRRDATGGESQIPMDDETRRCVADKGYGFDSILAEGVKLEVRRTANLHTGGTIHDVTDFTHPDLIEAAEKAARAIDIPVVGIDFMVKDPSEPDYAFIEANERPGLANHEPQPTAERFMDLLFPLTVAYS